MRVCAESYTQYEEAYNVLRGSGNMTVPDAATPSDEINSLLIEVKQLVKSLEDAHREAVAQRDQEQALLVYQKWLGKPRLSINDPKLYDEQERVERETEFIVRAKLWMREVEGLL